MTRLAVLRIGSSCIRAVDTSGQAGVAAWPEVRVLNGAAAYLLAILAYSTVIKTPPAAQTPDRVIRCRGDPDTKSTSDRGLVAAGQHMRGGLRSANGSGGQCRVLRHRSTASCHVDRLGVRNSCPAATRVRFFPSLVQRTKSPAIESVSMVPTAQPWRPLKHYSPVRPALEVIFQRIDPVWNILGVGGIPVGDGFGATGKQLVQYGGCPRLNLRFVFVFVFRSLP